MLADMSARFVNVSPADVDREIEDALRRACRVLGIDLAVLWQWADAAAGVITPTHFYFVQAGLPAAAPIRQDSYPWYVAQMLAGHAVVASTLDDLPAEAAIDRENTRLLGIQSNLTLPLAVGGEPPIGALGLNTIRTQRDWSDELVKRLQLVAQVFTNALVRKRADEALRASEARLAAAADLDGLGYYEVDFEKGTAFVDDRFRASAGIPADRLHGLQPLEFWMEHLHPDDRPRVLEPAPAVARREAGAVLSIEYRFLHPAQGEKWFTHMAPRRQARRHRARTPVVRRRSRHHGAQAGGGGAAAVATRKSSG